MRPMTTTLLGLAMVLAVSSGCSTSSSNPTSPVPPTVDTTAPTVSMMTPANVAGQVANITATFSESMIPATISTTTFTVTGPDGNLVPGAVHYDAVLNTATFSPSVDLVAGATYEARITAGVRDLAGNPMQNDAVWSFRVAIPPSPEAPQTPRSG